LTQEILRIGRHEIPSQQATSSGDEVQDLGAEGDCANGLSDKDKNVREIEDYPFPLAVVGVSVLYVNYYHYILFLPHCIYTVLPLEFGLSQYPDVFAFL